MEKGKLQTTWAAYEAAMDAERRAWDEYHADSTASEEARKKWQTARLAMQSAGDAYDAECQAIANPPRRREMAKRMANIQTTTLSAAYAAYLHLEQEEMKAWARHITSPTQSTRRDWLAAKTKLQDAHDAWDAECKAEVARRLS